MDAPWNSHFRYQDPCGRPRVRDSIGPIPGVWPRLLVAIALAIFMADFTIAAPQLQTMDGRAVAKVVDEFFASQPDYQRGDLITRSQIEKVVAKLVDSGVPISEPTKITRLGLPDDSFLARELSTPSGKRFMRKVTHHSGGFSHLDRLSTIPRGQEIIRDLVRQKDGDKLIEYLATTKGGKNMGSMMGNVRGGDLNKPTGRIYTTDDLLKAILSTTTKP